MSQASTTSRMVETKIPKVFISSTLEDLEPFRAKALEAISKLGWLPIDCGYWAASGNPPLGTCLKKVDDADVVVAIVAHRHGWTPPDQPAGEHKSITRLECERAKASGKSIEVIPFLVDEKVSGVGLVKETDRINEAPADKIEEVLAEVGRNVLALKDFKAWLDGIGTRKTFSSPDQLCTEVLHALKEWGDGRGLKGSTAPNAVVRERYLAWLRRTCETVELLGLDAKQTQNVRLGQVYVPAVATETVDIRSDIWLLLLDRLLNLDLLLHRLSEGSLYVPGAPGAGKSTFCRWVALVVASGAIPPHPIGAPREFEEQLPDALSGRFPLLCRLREWAGHPKCVEGNGRWTRAQLEESLACWIATVKPGELSPELFRDQLKSGTCLLILDGVDEVPERIGDHLPRRNLLSGLADALHDWHQAGNRILLTSRPYGLSDEDRRVLNLTVADLGELPPPLQDTFVRRWYAAADPARAHEKASGLLAHLADRRDLDELRANPMLLTALCVKYDEGQRLPKDFYRLYDSVVSQVLHKRYATENDRDRARIRLAAIALGMHAGSRTKPRATPEAEVSWDEVEGHLVALSQTDPTTESGALNAATRREDLLSNSGLLLPRANKRAAFYHLTFQEFFAAVRMRRLPEKPEDLLARYARTPEWRRALTFLFCAIADQDSPESAANAYAALLPELTVDRLSRNANPALLLADCIEIAHARGWNLDRFAAPFRQACEHALAHFNPPIRASLWRTLGRIGLDDRQGVAVRNGLPNIDWVAIPAGQFGEKEKIVSLPEFCIARYPITNSQYQCFIDAGGYDAPEWWEGLAGHPAPRCPQWDYPNHPRETVSWYESVAFSRWLDARLRANGALPPGWEVRPPTEQEWEKAARGTDGREYPWGEYADGRANVDESASGGPNNLRRTSAVGIYPNGASPFGVPDMAGNVWEWCLNKSNKPIDHSLDGIDSRVRRGGSWYGDRRLCRCAIYYIDQPEHRSGTCGFRVCCVPRIQGTTDR
jgi:formylglycine-generating enzyme required for sulfatase activity